MPSTITLTHGEPIYSNQDAQTLVDQCEHARANGTVVHVDRDDDDDVWFNPHAVVTITSREQPTPSFAWVDTRST